MLYDKRKTPMKNYTKNIAWKLIPGPLVFMKN